MSEGDLNTAVTQNTELENVAITNALLLEAARRRAFPIRFNFVAHAVFEVAQHIPVTIFERFYC